MVDNFNSKPPYFKVIDESTFARMFFHYCLATPEYRQMYKNNNDRYSGMMKGRLFRLDYKNWNDLGVAIVEEYIDVSTSKLVFAQFGSPQRWTDLNRHMANQFAGDNS